jgi:tetratricopeptide (TPR) repeat protein
MAFGVVRHLLNRRVPQILGLYLGASWVIIEFVSLLVDRFTLSPHLIEFSLVVLGALVPTVLLLAYFHGAPGRNDWTTTEKIGIPVNLVAAAVLVVAVFSDRPLGAATTRLVLENEEGQTVERVVPISEFRRKLILFNFENESGDSSLEWMQLGLTLGLLLDMDQDVFVDFGGFKGLQEKLERAGYPEGVGLPVSLMAKLAGELQRDYFVTGTFSEQDGQLSVQTSLYETRRHKLLAENSFAGTDILDLVDEISVQARRDLGIPERHIEETADLRVADILTSSTEAAKLQMMAFHEIIVTKDWEAAADYLEQAVEVDPTSAFAQFQLAVVYLISSQKEKADSAAQLAMEYLYRLPERWQYDFKYLYYDTIDPDPDKRFAVARMIVELFPDELEGHALMAEEYEYRNQRDAAISEYEYVLELDPSQHRFLRWIGHLYRAKGDFDAALEYFQRYADAVPNDHTAFDAMGDLYATMGEHERARFYYERALIIDPDNVYVTNDLAAATFNIGDIEGSLELHREALETSRTAQERASAHARLSYHFLVRGRLAEAIEHKKQEWRERQVYEAPAVVLSGVKLMSLDLFAKAGRSDEAFEIIRQAELELAPPFNLNIPFGYLAVYLEVEDADRAQAAHAEAEARMEESGKGQARPYLLASQGKIHELRGEYEEAIDSYAEALAFAPTEVTINRSLGRCYRMLGQLAEAEKELLRNLTVTPQNPLSHYELAMVYAEGGRRSKALEHLQVALHVWSDADPDFKPAQDARQRMAELDVVALGGS